MRAVPCIGARCVHSSSAAVPFAVVVVEVVAALAAALAKG
jgi:hypothetical protein